MRNDIITEGFEHALRDYAYLLERHYPRKSILKIVGDRYQLHAFQRILLNRGIFPREEVSGRKVRMVREIEGKILHVDLYNIVFTVSNYLLGRMVFIANDGFIRDAGEMYGKLNKDPVFERSLEMMFEVLGKTSPESVQFYLDQPVSHSADLAARLRYAMKSRGLSGGTVLHKHPDSILIQQTSGIIASSDSDVLLKSKLPIFDLAHMILRHHFELKLPDLATLMTG